MTRATKVTLEDLYREASNKANTHHRIYMIVGNQEEATNVMPFDNPYALGLTLWYMVFPNRKIRNRRDDNEADTRSL